jgi:hypothetical protein
LRNYQLHFNISFAPAPAPVTHVIEPTAVAKKVKKEGSPLKQFPPCDIPGCPSEKNAHNRGLSINAGNTTMVLCKIGHFKAQEEVAAISNLFANKEVPADVAFDCFYCDIPANRVISCCSRNHGYKLVIANLITFLELLQTPMYS